MASRSRRDENAHDKGVERVADRLERDGWNVRADIAGWPQPRTIAGRRPDVIATKRGSRRIIEVETDRSDDHRQHEKFRRHQSQKANTKFIGYVVDSIGRRRETFY